MIVEQVQNRSIVRGVVQSVDSDCLVLRIPHQNYQLHLVPPAGYAPPLGRRIRGTIRATALKIHPAHGGGCFIEPVYGAPRIVAGSVLAVDEESRRVLLEAGVPMWVDVPADQDLGLCREGELLNFYVASGTSFVPDEG